MNNKKPELIKTNLSLVRYKQDILDFADDIGSLDVHLGDVELLRKDFTGYLQNLINHDHGRQLPAGWVRHSMYWYINFRWYNLGNFGYQT
jgi:predicted acetyltransferase